MPRLNHHHLGVTASLLHMTLPFSCIFFNLSGTAPDPDVVVSRLLHHPLPLALAVRACDPDTVDVLCAYVWDGRKDAILAQYHLLVF